MKNRDDILKYILIFATFVAITVFTLLYSCEIFRIIPLYVSLIVMFLQMKASRLSFLVGGCNAAYYAGVYLYLELYGMALYSMLIACPIQFITFIRWRKRAYAHSAVLKRLSNTQRLGCVLGFGTIWFVLYFMLRLFGSEYIILDNSIAVISTAANLASMLCLIEFPYIQCVTFVLNISLYIQMIRNDPKQWTFLVYTVYALVCAVISGFYMQKLYNKQKIEIST